MLICYPAGKTETSYIVPSGVTGIGGDAFFGCDSLTEVVISEGVTSIEQDAFSGCDNLVTLRLPKSVMNIGDYVFYSCGSLKSIQYAGTTAQWKAVSKEKNWNFKASVSQIVCENGTINP